MGIFFGELSPVNEQETWDGNYESKDYQLVTQKDAEKMCEALESARMDSKIEEKMGTQEAQFLKWKLGAIESFLRFCSGEAFRIF